MSWWIMTFSYLEEIHPPNEKRHGHEHMSETCLKNIKKKDCPAKEKILNRALPSSFFRWMLYQLTSHPPAPIAGISKRYRRLPMPFHRTRQCVTAVPISFSVLKKQTLKHFGGVLIFGVSLFFGTFVCFWKIMMTLAVETAAFISSEEWEKKWEFSWNRRSLL